MDFAIALGAVDASPAGHDGHWAGKRRTVWMGRLRQKYAEGVKRLAKRIKRPPQPHNSNFCDEFSPIVRYGTLPTGE
jgi:hypothetical protein